MEIEQTVNKRKKITRLLLILLIILLSLVCIKYLISKSSKYISENGKSSMGAVVEQIQQTYDLQVSGYYNQLQLVEEFLLHERELSLETDVVTQAVTLDELSLVGDVLMKVDEADKDEGKASIAARTLFAIRDTDLFGLFVSQVGNEEAVNRLLEKYLDEDGQPVNKDRNWQKRGIDWRKLI